MYEYKARLMVRSNGRDPVYDGDTVWLTVDLGFGVRGFDLGSCRLAGIDTPELRTPTKEAGILARDALRAMLRPLEEFRIQTFKDDMQGKYGRYIVKLFLPDGRCVNDLLVERGLAVPVTY